MEKEAKLHSNSSEYFSYQFLLYAHKLGFFRIMGAAVDVVSFHFDKVIFF